MKLSFVTLSRGKGAERRTRTHRKCFLLRTSSTIHKCPPPPPGRRVVFSWQTDAGQFSKDKLERLEEEEEDATRDEKAAQDASQKPYTLVSVFISLLMWPT